MAVMNKAKNALTSEDLADLAKLATLKEWGTLCRMLDNRVARDKNAIVSYPDDEPVKLATMHAFYKGRISAINRLKGEVRDAGKMLEQMSEKVEKKEK